MIWGHCIQYCTANSNVDFFENFVFKTIYSFQDKTQNIGKFTNAGVKLDDAVMAIKGISNEAALSGANANEASRAMYNFAQALSAGYVKLIDWKSIENANMATVEFKTQLLESAVAAGTLEKTDYGTYNGYASLGIQTNTSLYVNDEIRKLASPINHLDANDPPCKILMGDMDEVVSPISTQKFKDACDAAGVSCELVWLKNAGHVYDSMNGEQVLPRFSVQKMKLVDFAISCVTPQ